MVKVYEHSYCNISALVAHDSSMSIFAKRDSRTIITQKSRLTKYGVPFGFNIYQDLFSLWQHLNENHLNKRGWVVQERLLSKRVLHFGIYQISWECQELQRAESEHLGHDDGVEYCYAGGPRHDLTEFSRITDLDSDISSDSLEPIHSASSPSLRIN